MNPQRCSSHEWSEGPNSPASREIKKLAATLLGEEYKPIRPKRLERIMRALRRK